MLIQVKQDSEVSFGQSERPKYGALKDAINGFYSDLRRPLERLEAQTFMLLGLPKPKAESFRYTAAMRRVLDEAIDLYLNDLLGPDRSREGFVEGGAGTDTPDGVVQQWERFSFAVGLRRGADLVDRPQTLSAERNSPATKAMLDNAFTRLSENGTLTLARIRDEVHSVLTSATQAGLSPIETGRQLSNLYTDYNRVQFERLARTEAAFASIEGSRMQMEELGVRYVKWLISAGACPICQSFEGLVIGIEETDRHPPAASHPNCCIEGTIVTGPRALASTERWFVGEVVDLETRSGNVLSVTPNHPILTPKGWIAAGLLNEGDEVVSAVDGEVPTLGLVHPDDYQIPARIEDVARTLRGSSSVTATGVPTTAEDFHGDGLGSEVCIVRTNRELRDALDAPEEQPIPHYLFSWRHAEFLGLSRQGSGTHRVVSVALAAPLRLRRSGHLCAAFGSAVRRESGLYVPEVMERDTPSREDTADGAAADMKVPSESELVMAGKVEPDQLVLVKRRMFEGHVFNLQTNCGWYVASNIVTHNCLCDLSPA